MRENRSMPSSTVIPVLVYPEVRQAVEWLSRVSSLPYGERQYTVTDLGGYAWTFSESVDDIAPSARGGELVGAAS